MSRQWAMPNAHTFSIKPIAELLDRYLIGETVDPFARDAKHAIYTNDINPDTSAEYHLDALAFLDLLIERSVMADVVLLDPPYSPRQISECYRAIGRKVTQQDTQVSSFIQSVKNKIDQILKPDGIVICFGWNTVGMGIKRGYQQIEIMLVCHGGTHNDTIVTVEQKLSNSI